MMTNVTGLGKFPNLTTLVEVQLRETPKHENFVRKRFKAASQEELVFAESLATTILRLTDGNLPRFCKDYDWICQLVLKEELHFRRTGRYRLSKFEDALAEVYSNSALMDHYMNGLLMTSLWWSNHTAAMQFFVTAFLPGNRAGCRHLEIGPGHGLLLALAAKEGKIGFIDAWDVSAQSIENTRAALQRIGVDREISLEVRDLFAPDAERGEAYDSVVLSEVLEHLEHPKDALGKIRRIMVPGGRLFINMPINSPAPDHLFLLDTPDEVVSFIESAGFDIEQYKFEPTTNYTLEQARTHKFTISCLVVARRPISDEGTSANS